MEKEKENLNFSRRQRKQVLDRCTLQIFPPFRINFFPKTILSISFIQKPLILKRKREREKKKKTICKGREGEHFNREFGWAGRTWKNSMTWADQRQRWSFRNAAMSWRCCAIDCGEKSKLMAMAIAAEKKKNQCKEEGTKSTDTINVRFGSVRFEKVQTELVWNWIV